MLKPTQITRYSSIQFGLSPTQHSILSNIDIELSERCNNNCIHCYINLRKDDKEAISHELDTYQWKDILKQAAELGALWVRFSGGEPLLRRDFQELYVYTRKLGLQVMLFTNACLITPEIADLFQRLPPGKKIEITHYGMTEKSNEEVTRSDGSYFSYKRGINLLLERNIPFVVKSVILPPTKGEERDFEEWVSTLPYYDHKPAYVLFLDLRARRDSETKNEFIKTLRLSPEESLKYLSLRRNEYYSGIKVLSRQFLYPQGDALFSCGAGDRGGCVNAYGNYQLCMSLRHPDTVYDITNGSLFNALVRFSPLIRKIKATNLEYLQKCANCFIKGICEQCPAKSWMEHGTLDTPVDYLCQVAHAQARYLGLLHDKENAWEVSNWRARLEKFSFGNCEVK